MAEYIDREKINEIAFTDAVLVKGEVRTERVALLREIDEIPKANVREVVLCKDCKFNSGAKKCLNPDSVLAVPADDDFCSYGERKKI